MKRFSKHVRESISDEARKMNAVWKDVIQGIAVGFGSPIVGIPFQDNWIVFLIFILFANVILGEIRNKMRMIHVRNRMIRNGVIQ